MKWFTMGMLALGLLGFNADSASAEVKIVLSEMHLCCGACVRDVNAAVVGLEGVTLDVDRGNAEVTVKATDDKTAQKAVDAIAKAGYHAASNHATIKMKDDSGAPQGKVKRLEVSGLHNCCGGCTNAIRDAVKGVSGVAETTLKTKDTSFVVEGDFIAADIVKALNEAGFHAKVK